MSMVVALLCVAFTSCKRTNSEVTPSPVHKVSPPQNTTFGLDDSPKRVKGTIKKPSTAALVGATVSVYDGNEALVIYTLSGEYGIFNLDSVLPGTYNVVIEATGYQSKTIEDVLINDDGLDYDMGDIYLDEE